MSNENNGGRGVAKTVIESAVQGPPGQSGGASTSGPGWGQGIGGAQSGPGWGQAGAAGAASQSGWGQNPGGAQAAGGASTSGQQGWGQPAAQQAAPQAAAASGAQQSWGQGSAPTQQAAGSSWGQPGAAGAAQAASAASSWGQTGGSPAGGGQSWAAPPGAHKKSGGGKGCILIAGLGTLLLGVCGVGGYFAVQKFMGAQELTIEAEVVEHEQTNQAYVHVTLEFVEELSEGDVGDVTLTLSSDDAMSTDIVHDWAWIASNDNLPETVPSEPPPMNTPLEVYIPIEHALYGEVYFDGSTDRIKINVRADWGELHQDTARADATALYDNPQGLVPVRVPIPFPAPPMGAPIPPAGTPGAPGAAGGAPPPQPGGVAPGGDGKP